MWPDGGTREEVITVHPERNMNIWPTFQHNPSIHWVSLDHSGEIISAPIKPNSHQLVLSCVIDDWLIWSGKIWFWLVVFQAYLGLTQTTCPIPLQHQGLSHLFSFSLELKQTLAVWDQHLPLCLQLCSAIQKIILPNINTMLAGVSTTLKLHDDYYTDYSLSGHIRTTFFSLDVPFRVSYTTSEHQLLPAHCENQPGVQLLTWL